MIFLPNNNMLGENPCNERVIDNNLQTAVK